MHAYHFYTKTFSFSKDFLIFLKTYAVYALYPVIENVKKKFFSLHEQHILCGFLLSLIFNTQRKREFHVTILPRFIKSNGYI